MSGYHSMPDGGKGYKPAYPGHKAMCADIEKEGKNTDSTFNVKSKKVTEGRKPNLHDKSTKSTPKHGDRGYKAAKLRPNKMK